MRRGKLNHVEFSPPLSGEEKGVIEETKNSELRTDLWDDMKLGGMSQSQKWLATAYSPPPPPPPP